MGDSEGPATLFDVEQMGPEEVQGLLARLGKDVPVSGIRLALKAYRRVLGRRLKSAGVLTVEDLARFRPAPGDDAPAAPQQDRPEGTVTESRATPTPKGTPSLPPPPPLPCDVDSGEEDGESDREEADDWVPPEGWRAPSEEGAMAFCAVTYNAPVVCPLGEMRPCAHTERGYGLSGCPGLYPLFTAKPFSLSLVPEMVTRQEGFRFRVFRDKDPALKWCLESLGSERLKCRRLRRSITDAAVPQALSEIHDAVAPISASEESSSSSVELEKERHVIRSEYIPNGMIRRYVIVCLAALSCHRCSGMVDH